MGNLSCVEGVTKEEIIDLFSNLFYFRKLESISNNSLDEYLLAKLSPDTAEKIKLKKSKIKIAPAINSINIQHADKFIVLLNKNNEDWGEVFITSILLSYRSIMKKVDEIVKLLDQLNISRIENLNADSIFDLAINIAHGHKVFKFRTDVERSYVKSMTQAIELIIDVNSFNILRDPSTNEFLLCPLIYISTYYANLFPYELEIEANDILAIMKQKILTGMLDDETSEKVMINSILNGERYLSKELLRSGRKAMTAQDEIKTLMRISKNM